MCNSRKWVGMVIIVHCSRAEKWVIKVVSIVQEQEVGRGRGLGLWVGVLGWVWVGVVGWGDDYCAGALG